MIELVITYCLSTDMKTCVEKKPMFDFELTQNSCMILAQEEAAKYVEEHPAYELKTFRCEINKPPEKAA